MRKHEAFHIYPDGRLVWNQKTAAGKRGYAKTLEDAYERQGHICPKCERYIARDDLTPDHFLPKGMGGSTRDDRPENIVAMHRWCNSEKGSRRGVYEKP